jgi:serine phosphatase RsbU (regulator of sigma subunit)/DNA-binding LacI/PurR family transcriptional regulator
VQPGKDFMNGKVVDVLECPGINCSLIGFLTESVSGLYQSNIWIGASDTALKRDYGLICFAGGSLTASSWDPFEPQRNAIYNLIDTKRLKGLIISGSLGSFISKQEFETFYHKFKEIPMVCIGPEIQSIPTVVFDNVTGMRELISHIVSHHSCQRIAFIRGPEGNQEAEQRLKIFCEVLESHGLTIHSELIVPGDFSRDAGSKAVQHLVDNCNLSFDAIVGANDDMALGALKAFQERHIRVPDEVLVVGFDDNEESSFSIPSLTTVRQPLYKIGSKAVELLIDTIEYKNVPEKIVVPATVEIRQSCGCYRFGDSDSISKEITDGTSSLDLKKTLQSKVVAVLKQIKTRNAWAVETNEASEFTDAFLDEIAGKHTNVFLPLVSKLAKRIATSGGDATGFLRIVTVLRNALQSTYSNIIPVFVEELLQNTSLCIADTAARVQAHRRMESERQWTLLRAAGQAIASAFDLKHLLDVIKSELVNLCIKNCWLSLYQTPQLALSKYDCILILSDGKRTVSEPIPFENSCFAPPGYILLGIPVSILIEPLFFRNEQIGFITFQVDQCRDGLTYEMLRQHISSALKGALLMQKVQEQALALETANQQLQKLRDTEHAYLDAIKHELELGREIQGSFLPREMPEIKGWEVWHAFSPAREVSGDFYDVFTLPSGQIAFIIADVSGKDVGAALFMVLIRTLIRSLTEMLNTENANPLNSVELTNKYLINHHYGNNGRYMYATLFMAVLDLDTNVLSYVNAGHNPPAIVKSQGGIRKWISPTAPAVGIIPDGRFELSSLQLEPGEMLFAYTDGVTEARDGEGNLFTKNKLASILEMPFSSATEAVKHVESAVNEHCEGLAPHDDITMLVLRRTKLLTEEHRIQSANVSNTPCCGAVIS